MKNLAKLSVALGITCAVAATVLAFAYRATAPAQKTAQLRQRQKALALVLPAFDNQPLQEANVVKSERGDVTFYPAKQEGKLVAWAAKAESAKGYGGKLDVLVGIDPDGTVRAVIVTEHSETPGLGTQATDRSRTVSFWDFLAGKSGPDGGLPPSPYLDQYTGEALNAPAPFSLTKSGGKIEAVSGATISSTAVMDAVNTVATAYAKHKMP